MIRSVVYHPKVPKEVRAFIDHYESISQELGDSFWCELMEVIDYARDFPERHHFDRTGRRRSNLKRFPVHILFRLFPDFIRITAVRHDHQNPEYAARRQ
jgi:plasmid stabilization system protein ParE